MANSKIKQPTKAQLLAEIHDVYIAGVSVPKETLKLFLDNDPSCFDIAMGTQNQELRTSFLSMLCVNEGGEFTDLIKKRGYQFVDKSLVDDDYEFAELMSFPFGDAATPILVLKLINRTLEPGSQGMTEEQRLAAGLTKEGFKIYILGITDKHVQPYVIVKEGKNKGRHPLTNRLTSSIDRNGVKRFSRTYWEENEEATNIKFEEEEVTLRSKLDLVGYTFGLFPGEYSPDAEA